MINKLNFLHYLSKETYKNICNTIGVDDRDQKIQNNKVFYPDKPIYCLHPFNILYEQLGHIWFLSVKIDFPKFACDYNDFEKELFDYYIKIFGKDVMDDFPEFTRINCDYAEFSDIIHVDDTDKIINYMAEMGCPTEQLDETKWEQYKKPHNTIAFCVSKVDKNRLKVMARCYGTALKSRIKDKSFHIATGVSAAKIVNEQTEAEIMNWLYKKYKINFTP